MEVSSTFSRKEDGKIYGRGASDMKGGVAAMTAVIQALLKYGKNQNQIFIFALLQMKKMKE